MTENLKRIKKKNTGRIPRRYVVLIGILLLMVCIYICITLPALNGYNDFLDALGRRESSDNYGAENRFGYLGRYQMGEMALQDAGFKDDNGAWTTLANSYGIYSDSDFLNSSAGQDAAIKTYHTKLCRYIKSYGLDQYVGTIYFDVEITESGLLAACHLVGVKNMRHALAAGEMVYDGNNVPASEYLALFAGYDISVVWNQ